MTPRPRSEILDEVDDLAIEVMKYDQDLSYEAAQAVVFEEIPELYLEYRQSTPEAPVQPIVKSEREPTLGEEIHRVVQKKAAQRAWTQWPRKSLEELEWDVWRTPEGEALYQLYKSKEGKLPFSEFEEKIEKAASTNDAWSILQDWRVG